MPELQKKPNAFNRFTNRLFDPGPLNDDNIRRNRDMADALLNQVSNPRIGHANQGYANLVQALNAQAFRQKSLRGEDALKQQRAQQMGDFLQAFQSGDEQALSAAIAGAQDNPVLASLAGPLLQNKFATEGREDTQQFQAGQLDTRIDAQAQQARAAREQQRELAEDNRIFNAQEGQRARDDAELRQIRDIQAKFTLQSNSQEFEKELKELAGQGGFDLSERQGKATAWGLSYAQGAEFLEHQLAGTGPFEGKGQYVPNLKDAAVFAKSIDEKTGAVNREVISRALSDPAISYFQSAYMMIDPIVRQRTGAAVREFEFITMVRTLMPLSNDTPQSLDQKKAARQAAFQGLLVESGPGARMFTGQGGQGGQQGVVTIDLQGNQL